MRRACMLMLGAALLAFGVSRLARGDELPSHQAVPAQATVGDASVTARLDTLFAADDSLRSVKAETNNGVVSLSGTVPSEASRLRAVELAKGTSGVSRVENNIKNPTIR